MKITNDIQLVETEDGSHSLFVKSLDETYHSTHGAIQESAHVFIKAGYDYVINKHPKLQSINILEFGFGTGLNALLTAQGGLNNINVRYDTLEKYPLEEDLISALNYGKLLGGDVLFKKIHDSEWEKRIDISTSFSIKKIKLDFRDYYSTNQYHLIYYDAFAPGKQPELWEKAIFEKCYKLLEAGGVLVTYSAKGQLKRDLKTIGFALESLPGPPGKFEITRAVKP